VTGSFRGFGPGAFSFLAGIAANNDRDWFRDHAADYEREVRVPFGALVSDLANELADRGLPLRASPKHGMFRIHRDVRFSHDKRPYKISVGAVSSRDGTRKSPGVVYVHVQPGNCFLAAGFYNIEPPLVTAFREAIVENAEAWRAVVAELASCGLELSREHRLVRLPRGYDASIDADLADAIRLKSFTSDRPLPDAAIATPGLVAAVADFAVEVMPLLEFGWRALEGHDAPPTRPGR
jgi:uncharacterized protein (TIGR02453 family)